MLDIKESPTRPSFGLELRWLTKQELVTAGDPKSGRCSSELVKVRKLQYRERVVGQTQPYMWTPWKDVPEVYDVSNVADDE